MINMAVDKLIKRISSLPLTIESWLLSAIGIILVRIFLEHYSSNEVGRYVLIDASTIVHYTTFFFSALLISTLALMLFSKKSLKESAALTLFGFMIIWLPPILDLVISKGNGFVMHYLFVSGKDLATAFPSLFWSTSSTGITYGIRVEILLVMLGLFYITYSSTKNIARSVMSSIFFYTCIFVLVSLPSVLGLFQEYSIPRFIADSVLESKVIDNSAYPDQFGYERLLDVGFNSVMTQVNLLIILLTTVVICLVGYKEKFIILLSNSRPERILHYSLLIIIGTLFGIGSNFFFSWVNVLSLVMTLFAFIFAWLTAVCINDIYDKEIDDVSNNNRPISKGLFTKSEFYSLSIIFTGISLVSAYASSRYGLFFVIAFSSIYYIYSTEPLRLKRHWISGALAIGFACLMAILAGFFLSSQSKVLTDFPLPIALALVIAFGLGSMVKDVKDYEGDKLAGMKTLPVLIGLPKAKTVIAVIVSAGLLGVAYYFATPPLIVSAIIASIFIWKILRAPVYKERDFFITYLSFLIVFIAAFVVV
jgi:4-hydroxybenzoate polyprenyltransferase